ncbi:cupin domain-containing protein [Nocardia cyriacigeorgica]|uniref:cupin domain-containing protein n=1 Tax=Nocardia cyriacigeorgica TaxID=135487 RepID=UPI001E560310|nr:cupin domain-containing protein [Nocardia cyriacigeorgica]
MTSTGLLSIVDDMDMLPVDRSNVECWQLGTDRIAVLATCAQTRGDLFAVEITMPPGGGPPVMHRHEPSEVYYVLAGEFTFYIGESDGVVRRRAGVGEVVPLAGGTPHTIRNETSSDAVAFAVHTPGGVMERFTRSAAELAAGSEQPDLDQVLALAHEHGIEMLGPVPAECV